MPQSATISIAQEAKGLSPTSDRPCPVTWRDCAKVATCPSVERWHSSRSNQETDQALAGVQREPHP